MFQLTKPVLRSLVLLNLFDVMDYFSPRLCFKKKNEKSCFRTIVYCKKKVATKRKGVKFIVYFWLS